jgi:hypothetical protein
MEWRCKWCGKPHEKNDPPCDNCGHGHLERAVKPVGPEGEGGATIWVCTECGRDHPRNNPPCSRCGNMTLEQREQGFEEGDHIGPETDAPSESAEVAGDVSETTTAWACTECGRDHTRNNPPCSRCGNMSFERRERRYDDIDATGSGWLAAVDRSVALGFVGAVLVATLAIGTALGFIAIPGVGGERIPADEVPGEAESAGGIDLAAVEDAYVTELDDRRSAADYDTLDRAEALDRRARWYNRRVVQSAYTDADAPPREDLEDAFGQTDRCSYEVTYAPFSLPDDDPEGRTVGDFASASNLGAALVDVYTTSYGGFTGTSNGFVGVDVHVGPDGAVYVTQFVC